MRNGHSAISSRNPGDARADGENLLQEIVTLVGGLLGAGVTILAALAFTVFVVWLITLL